jgi:hypothetical protein
MSANRTTFRQGDPRTVACATKGGKVSRHASPWGRVPFNSNARRTMRLEAIKRAALAACTPGKEGGR